MLLAMQRALAHTGLRFALFSDAPLLSGHGESARRRVARILEARSVEVYIGRSVIASGAGELELASGERFRAQASVWATGACAPNWIAGCGVGTDPQGFVEVGETLQSRSHAEIFAAGDIATIADAARPKSGAIAVRQGPVLARNLRLALGGLSPEPFRSPERTLSLISCGARYAVASWGRLALEGAWIWRWRTESIGDL